MCYYKLQVATLINVIVINLLIPTPICVRVCVLFLFLLNIVCVPRDLKGFSSRAIQWMHLHVICSGVMSLRNEKQYGFAWKRA